MTDLGREQLANDIDARRFTTTRLREGYDLAGVDWFLETLTAQIRQGADADGLVTEVMGTVFTPVRMREGYDMGEVDGFLDEVAGRLHELGGAPAVQPPPVPTFVAPPPMPSPAPSVTAPPTPSASPSMIPSPLEIPEGGLSKLRKLFGRKGS